MTPPVLLLGAQRSGTTALAHALSAAFHEAGGILTVNGKLLYLLQRWLTQDDMAARHLRSDEILHALRRRPPQGAGSDEWLARTEAALRDAAARTARGTATDAVTLARDIVSAAYGGFTRWGEKYNEYLLSPGHLARTVPDARHLLLVRHPEAVARSMLRWTGDRPWNPRDRDTALAKWAHWNACWLDFSHALPDSRRLVITYDRLCRGEETERLGAFLGLGDLGRHLAVLRPPESGAEDGPPLPAGAARTWNELLRAADSGTGPGPGEETP